MLMREPNFVNLNLLANKITVEEFTTDEYIQGCKHKLIGELMEGNWLYRETLIWVRSLQGKVDKSQKPLGKDKVQAIEDLINGGYIHLKDFIQEEDQNKKMNDNSVNPYSKADFSSHLIKLPRVYKDDLTSEDFKVFLRYLGQYNGVISVLLLMDVCEQKLDKSVLYNYHQYILKTIKGIPDGRERRKRLTVYLIKVIMYKTRLLTIERARGKGVLWG